MVNKELFDSYAGALEANTLLLENAFTDYAKEAAKLSSSKSTILAIETYLSAVKTHGEIAAVAALEFYEQQRLFEQIEELYTASTFYPDNKKLQIYDVKQAFKSGGDIAAIANKLYNASIERVMQYADETIAGNAYRDPARPRWALIPRSTACGWCRMIGSRGFEYSTRRTVENTRHPNCKCTPVVDFSKKPELEGYNPDALYRQYKSARDKIAENAKNEWQQLSDEQRAKYGNKKRGAYDHFLRNKLIAQMNK